MVLRLGQAAALQKLQRHSLKINLKTQLALKEKVTSTTVELKAALSILLLRLDIIQ